MTPERSFLIKSDKVEEYYWNGEMVVYVNNHSTEDTYEEACEKLKKLAV